MGDTSLGSEARVGDTAVAVKPEWVTLNGIDNRKLNKEIALSVHELDVRDQENTMHDFPDFAADFEAAEYFGTPVHWTFEQ